jgi:hypothetical protein
MKHSTPSGLETALGSIVAAWLVLSFVFAPVAFQMPGAEAHNPSSHQFQISPIPSGTRQSHFAASEVKASVAAYCRSQPS